MTPLPLRKPRSFSPNELFWREKFLRTMLLRLYETDPMVAGFLTWEEGFTLSQLASYLPPGSLAVEIGTFCGRSTRYLALGTLVAESSLICVDLFKGFDLEQVSVWDKGVATDALQWNQFLRGETENITRTTLLLTFLQHQDLLEHIGFRRGNSLQIAKGFAQREGGVDLLFIDGDHERCRQDVEAWLPNLQPWAMLAFHDISQERTYGVDGPINTVATLTNQGGWKLYGYKDSLGLLTRDPEWWDIRSERAADDRSSTRSEGRPLGGDGPEEHEAFADHRAPGDGDQPPSVDAGEQP